jgi:hypothetical protein
LPVNTGCLPLNYSGNPGVKNVDSYWETPAVAPPLAEKNYAFDLHIEATTGQVQTLRITVDP